MGVSLDLHIAHGSLDVQATLQSTCAHTILNGTFLKHLVHDSKSKVF